MHRLRLFVGNSHGLTVNNLRTEGGDLITGANVTARVDTRRGELVSEITMTESEAGLYEGTYTAGSGDLKAGDMYWVTVEVVDGGRRGEFSELIPASRREFSRRR